MKIVTNGRAVQRERSEMQDRYWIRDDGRAMAVFDGHWTEGEAAAQYAADFFEDTWDRYTWANRTEQFIDCDNEMSRFNGGTTATVAEIVSPSADEHLLVVHNVGDSPAYIVDPTGDNGTSIEMSAYHNVSNSHEIERMKREGSPRIGKYFAVNETYLQAVSRSLGDQACRGVIGRPSKYVERLSDGQLVVVATDGVLNEKTTDAVLARIVESDKANKSLDEMTEESITLAEQWSGDNATIIIAKVCL